MTFNIPTPTRSERTPAHGVANIIHRLINFYDKWSIAKWDGTETGIKKTAFFELFGTQDFEGEDGDDLLQTWIDLLQNDKIADNQLDLRLTLAILAYCHQAMDAICDERINEAWIYVLDANTWLAMLDMAHHDGGDTISASARAKKAANVRHTENHALKAFSVAWYKEHQDQYRSVDQAAEAIAGKVVPVAFTTARRWIEEFKRKK